LSAFTPVLYPIIFNSSGIFLEYLPFPPAANSPTFSPISLNAYFMAAQVVVVSPEECQSKPRRHPKDWNHPGSESLFNTSS